ncbi:Zinc finger MYM-type protein 1-like [Oopsacas minuta]|uniref:Zinc finger MYM-type protein 1-like n=1 Tax=Oopsacas minuta TaxID=111878 RepID=A0AAV7K3A6_9METZ|nr:Zinc finger MYM-type protein 1-like [Oopsacas minuta]
MSHMVLRKIVQDVHNCGYWSLLIDESQDITAKEQVVFALRVVRPDPFDVSGQFLGFAETAETTGDALAKLAEVSLTAIGLDFQGMRGMAFDGAASMTGKSKRVRTRLGSNYPFARFSYCKGHCLNSVLQEAVRQGASMRRCIDIIQSVIVYVKSSPRRLASFTEFENGQEDYVETEKLKKLCPTRWVMRMLAVRAILQNYAHLLDWFQQQFSEGKTEDKQATLIHINNLSDFSVFFSLNTLMRLFAMVHPIHKWVQGVNITISETRKSFATLVRLLHLEAVVQGERRRIGGRIVPVTESDIETYFMSQYRALFQTALDEIEERFHVDEAIVALEDVLIRYPETEASEVVIRTVSEVFTADVDAKRPLDVKVKTEANQTDRDGWHVLDFVSEFQSDSMLPVVLPNFCSCLRLLLVQASTTCTA